MGIRQDPAAARQPTRPEDAGMVVRYHEGNFIVDGLAAGGPFVTTGVVICAATPDERSAGGVRTFHGLRGDPVEAARALAQFLHLNPPLAAMVDAMRQIAATGRLDGQEGGT